jgi:hypothetical protein
MYRKMGARPLLAETEYEFAAMLTTRDAPGDREKALDLLNSAIAATREMGMNPLMEKALSLKLHIQGVLKA